jgi:hypothetical protein
MSFCAEISQANYIRLAPVGYINRTAKNGKKYISPDGEQAKLMEWAFKEISKGKYSTEQIFKKAVESGLNCCKNNLRLIRNPIYCGKIPIAQYKRWGMLLLLYSLISAFISIKYSVNSSTFFMSSLFISPTSIPFYHLLFRRNLG